MLNLGAVSFLNPIGLSAFIALPLLWFVLRAVPPAPVRQVFPAVTLLIGMQDDRQINTRTPWWLLVLRMLVCSAIILAFAHPLWRAGPSDKIPTAADRPLLLLIDDGWASAEDWSQRMAIAEKILGSRQALVAIQTRYTPSDDLEFAPVPEALKKLGRLQPVSWRATTGETPEWAKAQNIPYDTVWLVDGLQARSNDQLVELLSAHGDLRIVHPATDLLALDTPEVTKTGIRARVQRPYGGAARDITVQAWGFDPAGTLRILASTQVSLPADEQTQIATIDMPFEQRNRVTRLTILEQNHAGAVQLFGDSLRRPKIGLVAGENREGLNDLLAPLHYIRAGLAPQAELVEGILLDVLNSSPDVMILTDVAALTQAEQTQLQQWVFDGGILIRFAGAMMARDASLDPLLPVRLREGGRQLGGAMSWTAPKMIAPFASESPFFGLDIPAEVSVATQVLAQPSADLARKTWASLQDGTPLVTQSQQGKGRIILFHVTANAEWSNLPLSGLFMDMFERLLVIGGGQLTQPAPNAQWRLESVLDGFGILAPSEASKIIMSADIHYEAKIDLPGGIYASEQGHWPVNAHGADNLARQEFPQALVLEIGQGDGPQDLKGGLLALAAILLCLDVAVMLRFANIGTALMVFALWMIGSADRVWAQDDLDHQAIQASTDVTFAYVLTGNAEIDRVSHAGLLGLGATLRRRTTISPGMPVGVDLEVDELAFFPLLYWPVDGAQALPSSDAIGHLRHYLQQGGMILFDTRDGDLDADMQSGPAAARLRAIAAPLGLPALEPLPPGHVLTRSFYLLDAAPGRYDAPVWVRAGAQRLLGDNLTDSGGSDGVTPVVIGGNDWASAWAIDEEGNRLLPVGRGAAGERQREIAMRFGVNLVMYALTGNYKADQVHIPAFLDRLGEGKYGN